MSNTILAEPPSSSSQYASMIIHEMRNPLTSISIANDVLFDVACDEHADPELRSMLSKMISRNVRRLQQLTTEFLNLSIMRPIPFTNLDLSELLEIALNNMSDRFFLNGISINRTLQPVGGVKGNLEELLLVFQNVLSNAVEAAFGDDRQIWVHTYESDGKVNIIIRDNGPGIDKDQIENLFEPTLSKKYIGHSLGLVFSKMILDDHEASVTVRSGKDAGTIFCIAFSVSDDSEHC